MTRIVQLILNRSWGEADWIIPIIVHLKETGWACRVLLTHETLHARREDYSDLWVHLETLAEKIETPRDFLQRLGFARRISLATAFLRAKRRARTGFLQDLARLLFYPAGVSAAGLDLIAERLLAGCETLPSGVVFADKSFVRDADRIPSYKRLLERLAARRLYIYPHGTMIRWDLKPDDLWTRPWKLAGTDVQRRTRFLADTPECGELYSTVWGVESIVCGTPRFQQWWLARIKRPGSASAAGGKRLLFVSGFFRGLDSRTLAVEAIEAGLGCGWKIAVRLHPRESSSDFVAAMQSAALPLEKIEFVQRSVLSAAQDCDVAICLPSTACLDTVAAGLPTIEYCDYTQVEAAVIQFKRSGETESYFGRFGIVETIGFVDALRRRLEELANPQVARAAAAFQFQAFCARSLTQQRAGDLVAEDLETAAA